MTEDFHAKYAGVSHEQLYQQIMASDPEQVAAVAAKITSLRNTLGTLRDTLHADLAGLHKSWASDAGIEYQRRLGLIADFASSLHADMDSVQTTLTNWVPLLKEARTQAEKDNPAKTDDHDKTIKDAAIGAAIGSPLGPPGMVAGGVIGGWMGHDEDEEEKKKAHDRMVQIVTDLAVGYYTTDRMPDEVTGPEEGVPVDTTNVLTDTTTGPGTKAVHAGPAGTNAATFTAAPVVDPTETSTVTSLSGADDTTGAIPDPDADADSLVYGSGLSGTGGSLLGGPGGMTAAGLGAAAAIGLGAYGASKLPFGAGAGAGANLANAEAAGGIGRPGNPFSGVPSGMAEEGSLGINRGARGGPGGAAAARRGLEDEDEEHRTWLTEDEMVWGDDLPNAPAVLGGADPAPEPPAPRHARPPQQRQPGYDEDPTVY
ncbi:hypothetical protein Dvina_30855 [Dactylosporangium vinaceum]|uniref:WXG100 family type VII secretion target n=1 Tax=Dactylosporangium vinaceum TaxID=53362 RepID=A0ABV5MJW8_9ACTN|nr:WXG100 family type VII secretion target [Dactylosporangium vinaceum]UAB92717.1 hypothetical protein Dvina_30855 [Dactylosporangium vinaceum]